MVTSQSGPPKNSVWHPLGLRERLVELGSRVARARGSGQLPRRLGLLVPILLGIAVFGSMLAVGGIHVPSLLILGPSSCLAAALVVVLGAKTRVYPAWVVAALAAVCLLQTVPLPTWLLTLIAPANADVWQSANSVSGAPGAWGFPVSLDPGASSVEALKWFAYACDFYAAAWTAKAFGLRIILVGVFMSALALAAITLAHELVGAERVYGLYSPVYANPAVGPGPLLNVNNLAGYLNLGTFVGLGLLVSRQTRVPRVMVAVGISIVLAVALMSGSRGGVGALLLGLPLWFISLRLTTRRTRNPSPVDLPAWLVAFVVVAAVGLALGAGDNPLRGLSDEGTKKLSLIGWTAPLIVQHFWTGIGRGAFETAFARYRLDSGHLIYGHAENFVAQWCAEWGVPVALLALVSLCWLLRPSRLGSRASYVASAARVGLAVLLAQNFVDLGLELLATGMATFVLLGGLWGAGRANRGTVRDESNKRGRYPAAGGIVAITTGLVVMAGVRGIPTSTQDRIALSAALEAGSPNFAQALVGAIRRHPADPHLPLLGALFAMRHGGNELAWLGRAIERDPMASRPYFVLAQALARRGVYSQARGALRRAFERKLPHTGEAARLALRISKTEKQLLEVVPKGDQAAYVLVALAKAAAPPLRSRLLREATLRDPDDVRARRMRAHELLRALDASEGGCFELSRQDCIKELRLHADALSRLAPDSADGLEIKSRLFVVQGKLTEAERMLRKGCPQYANAPSCYAAWFKTALRLESPPSDLADLAAKFVDAACTSSAEKCERAALEAGNTHAKREEWDIATQMFMRAAMESDSETAWKKVSEAALKAGKYALAERARARLHENADAKSAQTNRRALEQLAAPKK